MCVHIGEFVVLLRQSEGWDLGKFSHNIGPPFWFEGKLFLIITNGGGGNVLLMIGKNTGFNNRYTTF